MKKIKIVVISILLCIVMIGCFLPPFPGGPGGHGGHGGRGGGWGHHRR